MSLLSVCLPHMRLSIPHMRHNRSIAPMAIPENIVLMMVSLISYLKFEVLLACFSSYECPDVGYAACQVTRAWKLRKRKPGTTVTQQEASTWKKRLREMFAKSRQSREARSGGSVSTPSRPRAKAIATPRHAGTEGTPMLSNWLVARARDIALKLGTGTGLATFKPASPVQFLSGMDDIFSLPAHELPPELCNEGQLKRICFHPDGCEPVLALKRGPYIELHSIIDAGSVGFAEGLWETTRGGVHGSLSSDVWAHDLHNSVKAAIVQLGLWVLVLEWTLVCNWTRAPFPPMQTCLVFKGQHMIAWRSSKRPMATLSHGTRFTQMWHIHNW